MEGMFKYQLFSVNYCQFVTLSFMRLALGDGVVDRASYVRLRTSSSTSSSTRNSHVADSAAEERERQQDEMVQNLI
jgi:hypothetical protein